MSTLQNLTIGNDFRTELLPTGYLDASIQQAWKTLLTHSKSPEKVFQTPGYFEFISQLPNKDNSQELIIAKSAHNQEIMAVLPLRTGRRTLHLNVGKHTLVHLRLRTIALLGSTPLAADNPQLFDTLIDFIFQSFPQKNTIAMQSLPKDSDFYRYLINSSNIKKKYGFFIQDGWRICHTTPLPDSFINYLGNLKSKKRYNLNRQLKILEKDIGPLKLLRIDNPEHIFEWAAAIEKLVPIYVVKKFLNKEQFTNLAYKKLMLNYILKCNEIPCALIIGIKAECTYHIHNILYAQDKSEYSLGTSILHLATEDIIDNLKISLIDYGYGNPEHSHQSSNIPVLRGHAFLYQKTWANRLIFSTYAAYSSLVCGVKFLISRAQSALGEKKHKTPVLAHFYFMF